MHNTFGNKIQLTLQGASHEPFIGGIIKGLPAGKKLDMDRIRLEMVRRAPGSAPWSTARHETDEAEVISGLQDGCTTGEDLVFRIANNDVRRGDYEKMQNIPRPGHADYPAFVRYGKIEPGGGIFSGRMTAVLTFAGAVAKEYLYDKNISIKGYIASIGKESFARPKEQADEEIAALILAAKSRKDSLGGIIQCVATGLPVGLGEPFFDSVESRLSHLLFSIPAVKAVEFGDGFALSGMLGSEANDALRYVEGRLQLQSNHNGGINGGLTNGMPMIFRVGIKPTPSIGLEQDSVNLVTKENVKLAVRGRHDPCIVPRALPVVEAATAFVLLDFLLEAKL